MQGFASSACDSGFRVAGTELRLKAHRTKERRAIFKTSVHQVLPLAKDSSHGMIRFTCIQTFEGLGLEYPGLVPLQGWGWLPGKKMTRIQLYTH